MKFGIDWPSGFREDLKIMVMYMYLAPRQGQTNPWGQMADSSQFSPLNTLPDQLGPNSWVSSVFIPAFIANIGKYFFLKYDRQSFKSI